MHVLNLGIFSVFIGLRWILYDHKKLIGYCPINRMHWVLLILKPAYLAYDRYDSI